MEKRRLLKREEETKNLYIRNATRKESEDLQEICEVWNKGDKEYLEGSKFPNNYIEKCFKEGDLPPTPEASIEQYTLKSIYLKEEGKIIGFFDTYHGYPTEDTLFIGILLIAPDYQRKGYAQEVIDFISKEGGVLNYRRISIGVYLKNWKALRFWTNAGFDKVLGVYGDKEYNENSFAFVGLEKSLV
ncbi:GNAT family N-acetyltransferase [Clostridium sp. D2Q-11]|uniref:GNAT family N-acetyltransferase n=1 Tax=Anaeromonas frigoriresistens TaxID=2683708 RepID=A0A942V2H3_9FIRM|nr:GNAT family N-acetyltransferase [Anaeromonas frigoriresistens]MBS4538772.1 GNAT family N-acetyltransferase [Anaeromonas frigoriresistens]